MADTTTSRPRPRPRPRPIAKQSSNAGISSTPGASSSSSSAVPLSSPTARRVIVVEDTDEMFMRNRNRSSKTWQKMEQMNKEVIVINEDSSDSEEGASPRSRKHKKKKREHSAVPLWQNNKGLARMLSEHISSDSDDLEITGESSTPNGKGTGKRKRQRSRSRSITPPPALPLHQIQNAKKLVRQTLQAAVRPASPTIIDLDESTDTIILQPELDVIAQEIAENSRRGNSQAPEVTSDDEVVLTVKWQPHPLDANGRKEEWQYKIERSDNFRDLFEATAEDAGILSANLIMTYQGKRFFPSITPQTLRIWADAAELMAYEKTTYEYIHKNPGSIKPQIVGPSGTTNGPIDIDSDSDGREGFAASQASPPHQTQDSEAESEVEGDKFKLILRSALTGHKDVTLTVRSTTKCGAIVKAFLKKAGLADQYPEVFGAAPATPSAGKKGGRKSKAAAAAVSAGPVKDPRLCVDGDRMDNGTEIGDQDLEDGDMVEVVGL